MHEVLAERDAIGQDLVCGAVAGEVLYRDSVSEGERP